MSSASPGHEILPVHDTTGVVDAICSAVSRGLSLLTAVESVDGTASYTYDATGQLTGANYLGANGSAGAQADESYQWDANGNPTGSGCVVGTDNRLLSDGTYRYAYDAEGNRTARFIDADADGQLDSGDANVTQYLWDAGTAWWRCQISPRSRAR